MTQHILNSKPNYFTEIILNPGIILLLDEVLYHMVKISTKCLGRLLLNLSLFFKTALLVYLWG